MAERVLVVDPDRTLLAGYRDYLTIMGFDVRVASSGSECMLFLHVFRPDVIVLEPDMPNSWGERILATLRDDPDLPCVPVIVLSRLDCSSTAQPVREFHVKPLPMSELVESIRRATRYQLASAG